MSKRSIRISIFAIMCLFPLLINADIGPKPSLKFDLIYETPKNISIKDAQLIECQDKDCVDAKPLEELGPQRFGCLDNVSCQSLAYGYAPYHKLIINFSDQTRQSNVFSSSNFDSRFTVYVREPDLLVKEEYIGEAFNQQNIIKFLIALAITIISELIIALLFLLIFKLPPKILFFIILVNLISLPIIWFLLPFLKLAAWQSFLTGLTLAIILEALLIYWFSKKQVSLIRIIILSIVMNLVSLYLGTFIFL